MPFDPLGALGLGSHQPDLSANLDGGAPLADETQNAASPAEARAPEQERVSQQQFLRAVGNLEVRGTSKLLRLTCPLLATARGGARAGGAAASTSSSLAAAGTPTKRSRRTRPVPWTGITARGSTAEGFCGEVIPWPQRSLRAGGSASGE